MSRCLKIFFSVPEELSVGIERLAPVLGYEIVSENADLFVEAEPAAHTGLELKNGRAVISYARRHLFFRELGLAVEHAREVSFSLVEDNAFVTVGTMIDASRCAVPTVETICRTMDYLALMGYNLTMMYTEDTVALEGRPFFGYMRGRYTKEELKAIDDYAFDYGIEVIPCLECYGHMEKYLIWGEARPIKDTNSVLLARSEPTFAFLEQYIGTVAECFRSRRIHIGMDEALDMGRGRFLTQHGYVPPFEIFTEYMERLIGITNRYGLKPMMWSDMYFRTANDSNRYYGEDIEVPETVAARIPPEVELVFWHYGEQPYCDDYMLKKHKALNRNVLYCGGLWSWSGHFPEHNYAMDSIRFSLGACRKNGVGEAIAAIWSNDNAECDLFANLLGLSFFAELCYDENASERKLRDRFEATTGGDWNAFYSMSFYHNSFGGEKDDYSGDKWHQRFLGKPLFWQDILEGQFDTHLWKKPLGEHYARCAALEKGYIHGGRWDYLYELASLTFRYPSLKTEIAERLVPAYRSGDRETLVSIAEELLPRLKEATVALHEAHKTAWFDKLKALGWSNLDVRYGGVAARCDTAKVLIERYLDGKDAAIEELEQERLPRWIHGFLDYSSIATVNIKI